MKNLYAYANECIKELNAIGIYPNPISKVEVNTRAKHRWGQCKISNGKYSINISAVLLEDSAPVKSLKNTIYHELLHAVDGCMNHGDKWQMLADKVNRAYGYSISRCTSSDDMGVKLAHDNDYHYIVKCQKCNRQWKYMRNSRTVQCCRRNTATCPCGARQFIVIDK